MDCALWNKGKGASDDWHSVEKLWKVTFGGTSESNEISFTDSFPSDRSNKLSRLLNFMKLEIELV